MQHFVSAEEILTRHVEGRLPPAAVGRARTFWLGPTGSGSRGSIQQVQPKENSRKNPRVKINYSAEGSLARCCYARRRARKTLQQKNKKQKTRNNAHTGCSSRYTRTDMNSIFTLVKFFAAKNCGTLIMLTEQSVPVSIRVFTRLFNDPYL